MNTIFAVVGRTGGKDLLTNWQVQLAAALVVATPTASAQDAVVDAPLQGFQVTWDNDVWASGNTDRWYTNGIRASWTYGRDPQRMATQAFKIGSEWLLGLQASSISHTIGQSLYTPREITLARPQREDRPWGAWLYYGLTAHAYTDDEHRATELKLGVTGAAAQGEEVQRLVHRVVDAPAPAGWDQQLRPRLGVQLSHARVYRLSRNLLDDRLGLRWHWGAAMGNLRSYATLGAALLVGDLRSTDTPILVGNEGDFVVQDFNNRGLFKRPYAFAAVAGTQVAYNYFLSGSTPYGRPELDRRPRHAVLQWGFSLPLSTWLKVPGVPRVVYSQTRRSPEFDARGLDGREAIQRWGTFGFHWDLRVAR